MPLPPLTNDRSRELTERNIFLYQKDQCRNTTVLHQPYGDKGAEINDGEDHHIRSIGPFSSGNTGEGVEGIGGLEDGCNTDGP